jgi:putative hydrolase of the HAD superfamily
VIRMVSFDVWGTLVAAPPKLPELLANYFAARTDRESSEIKSYMKTISDDFDRSAIRSGRDIPSAEKLLHLAHAIEVPSHRVDDLEDEVRSHLKLAPPYLIEPAACQELWTFLRHRGIEITIASNSGFIGGEMMRQVLASLGVLDGETRCVFSDELGLAKPNREFFRHVAGEHDPATVLHVGDHAEADIAGATSAGMYALHYVRRGRITDRAGQIESIGCLPSWIDTH